VARAESRRGDPLPKAWEAPAAAALLLALAVQLASAVSADGLTSDEVAYIPAGYRHLTARDYRLNPSQPALGKMVLAAGLLGLPVQVSAAPSPVDELPWSHRFVFRDNDPARLIPRARLPVVLLTCGLAAVVYAWARQASGARAALIALGMTAFHPAVLAHGHLATTDMQAALWMLVASWGCWRWCRAPASGRAAVVGLAFGAAVATRLSAWLLLPVLAGLALARRPRAGAGASARRALVTLFLSLAILPPAVIWASYGFRRTPWPGAALLPEIKPNLGIPGEVLAAADSARLFPATYLEGIRYQIDHSRRGHPAYLLGHWSDLGWPHYYLVAFAVKNTPGFLIAIAAGAVAAWRSRHHTADTLHWSAPAVLVFAVASLGALQLGERYILPMYPYLMMLCASALAPLSRTHRGRVLLGLLAVLHAGPALAAARGGYLAYFNVLARGGEPPLLDSNLDWGQDLPRLAAWMRLNRVARVQLGYHGADDPGRFGIAHDDLPSQQLHPRHSPDGRLSGTVVVSPNLLFGLLPRLRETYEPLRARPPDARAGVFYVYFLTGGGGRPRIARDEAARAGTFTPRPRAVPYNW